MTDKALEEKIAQLETKVAVMEAENAALKAQVDNLSTGIGRGLWILGGGFMTSVVAWIAGGGLVR